MNSTVTVRFIEGPVAAADEIATIQRVGVDEYELTYSISESTGPIHRTRNNSAGIFRWFRAMIGLLESDVEPASRVQVDIPSFPAVIIDTKRIQRSYHELLNALECWLDEPAPAPTPAHQAPHPVTPTKQPVRAKTPDAPVRRSHHMFFDLGDD